MDELVRFLRDRLDEDEAAIEAPETWTEFEESQQGTRRVDVDHSIERVVACTRAWRGVHIARHDPARVMREIDADRQLLAQYAEVAANDVDDVEYAHGWANALGLAVRLRASAFSDRPGYREEWRP